jgi:type VI secretion system secreted protein Hcp
MAMTSYLKVEAANQGELKGDCRQEGREDLIVVYDVEHSVTVPTDPQTGQPTGKRMHKPLQIVKHKDQSSPGLFQACATGETVTVELKFFRSLAGVEEHYFTIKLEDAIVVDMREYTPMVFLNENQAYKDMEAVQFAYGSIIWTYEPDGIETQDNWLKPAS